MGVCERPQNGHIRGGLSSPHSSHRVFIGISPVFPPLWREEVFGSVTRWLFAIRFGKAYIVTFSRKITDLSITLTLVIIETGQPDNRLRLRFSHEITD